MQALLQQNSCATTSCTNQHMCSAGNAALKEKENKSLTHVEGSFACVVR